MFKKKKLNTNLLTKTKLSIHTKIILALSIVCLVVVTVSPIAYYGAFIIRKNTSIYPGYKIVRQAVYESASGDDKRRTCNKYSSMEENYGFSLTDYYNPVKKILGKEVHLDKFFHMNISVRVHCAHWCSEFADFVYSKQGYDLNLEDKYSECFRYTHFALSLKPHLA